MPKTRITSFRAEMANLMEKYDVHFVVNDDIDNCTIYMIQNDWEPLEVEYDWHDGTITAETIRNIHI